jgi:hypothetical protein
MDGNQPIVRPLLQRTTQHRINADNLASYGIRTHDPSVLASEDISYVIQRGHCDRPHISLVAVSLNEREFLCMLYMNNGKIAIGMGVSAYTPQCTLH